MLGKQKSTPVLTENKKPIYIHLRTLIQSKLKAVRKHKLILSFTGYQ